MKRRTLAALALVAMLGLPFLFLGCGRGVDPWASETGSPRIVVTVAPLYSFVRAIAGDKAAIKTLCTTTGPHHYETDYRDARLFDRADAVFAIGLQLDNTFSDALHRMARRPNLPYVKLGEHPAMKSKVKKMREHTHVKPDKNQPDSDHPHHHHGDWDPHLWLGLDEVVTMVELIRDQLAEIDAANAETYRDNAKVYIDKLKTLHAEGKKQLADKKRKRVIGFHDAFEYFASAYGLEIADVIELAPGDNPAQGHLAKLEKLCLAPDNRIGAILVEPQYPDSTSAKQLQLALRHKNVDLPLISVDPLETADADELKKEGASWYETRMRRNLDALAKGLK